MERGALLDASRGIEADWNAVIDDLGAEGLEQPGVNGEWSVRQVLAHMNAWERWQLVQLRCAFTGETPTDEQLTGGITYPPNEDMQEDAMNAMFMEGTKDMPTDEIVRHWRETAAMRTDWIETATQEQVDETIGGDWAGGTNRVFRLVSEVPGASNPEPVWARLMDQIEHARSHLVTVREWMAGRRNA